MVWIDQALAIVKEPKREQDELRDLSISFQYLGNKSIANRHGGMAHVDGSRWRSLWRRRIAGSWWRRRSSATITKSAHWSKQ